MRLIKLFPATLLCLLLFIASSLARSQTYTVLHSFNGGTDGGHPYGGVILDAAGNLYGVTQTRGSSGYGTIFKLDQAGNETVLYNFVGYPTDASNVWAALVRDQAGNLYGTSNFGGANNLGTVYKLDRTGKETLLHNFAGSLTDGSSANGSLLRDGAGNLYGTTIYGGSIKSEGNVGYGTVFKIDPAGNETVFYSFAAKNDGANPYASLIRDAAGNLYGTTFGGGGSGCGGYGCGTVFRLDKTGKETVLYSFTGQPDGEGPSCTLVMDAAGNLFGTTEYGGAIGYGTVFKLDKSGKETILHSFAGTPTDAGNPQGGLVRDSKGNLYGATLFGGGANFGTAFKVDTTGKETVLYSFSGGTDGDGPLFETLVLDPAGNLYGTTENGGDYGAGVVFKITPQK